MATEVTKLITVSLGKIHQSRQQKCGLNLRKSLLVASVLHKARDIYVAEIKSRRSDTEDHPAKRVRLSTQSSVTEGVTESPTDARIASTTKTTTTTTSSVTPSAIDITDVLASQSESENGELKSVEERKIEDDSTTEVNKENSPPEPESDNTSCRCLKRRHDSLPTDNVSSHTNPETREKITPKKRVRSESLSAENNNVTDSQQTEQMSLLVQTFNSSFAGFGLTEQKNCTSNSSVELNTFSISREPIALRA